MILIFIHPGMSRNGTHCAVWRADVDSASLSSRVKGWIVDQGHGFGKVMQPMRLSLVGASQGPDIFDIAEMLGKEETIKRIQYAMQTLKK